MKQNIVQMTPVIFLTFLVAVGTVAGVAHSRSAAAEATSEICSVDVLRHPALASTSDSTAPSPLASQELGSFGLSQSGFTSAAAALSAHRSDLATTVGTARRSASSPSSRLLQLREEGARKAVSVKSSRFEVTYEYKNANQAGVVVVARSTPESGGWHIEDETVYFPQGTDCQSDLIGQ